MLYKPPSGGIGAPLENQLSCKGGYMPVVGLKLDSKACVIDSISDLLVASLAFPLVPVNIVEPIVARIAIIVMATISSTRTKPRKCLMS